MSFYGLKNTAILLCSRIEVVATTTGVVDSMNQYQISQHLFKLVNR